MTLVKGRAIYLCQIDGSNDLSKVCHTKIAGKFLKAHLKGSHPLVHEAALQKDAEKQREKEQAKSLRKRGIVSPQSVSPLSRQMTLESDVGRCDVCHTNTSFTAR